MAITRDIRLATVLVLAIYSILHEAEGHRNLATPTTGNAIFDVTKFGAIGNGKPNNDANGESINGFAFMQAWQKACHCSEGSSSNSKVVVIPNGEFVVAQVIFAGPCKSDVTVELHGTILADSDVSQFPNHEFIVFQNVDGVTFIGQGTIDATSQARNSSNLDNNDVDFFNLMPSIKFLKVKNAVVEGITSLNPSGQHVLAVESEKISIRKVKFDTKNVGPNTNSNGIYISASNQVSVSDSFIRTAGDCVTIAPGSMDISITGLTCEAGQGITIGSKAYTDAKRDVKGVIVKNCIFKGTISGVRILPHLEAKASLISNIVFENLTMEQVQNPVVINQQPGGLPMPNKSIIAKIRDVYLKNIKGTTMTKKALSFSCSTNSPCEGIEVSGIDLNIIGKASSPKKINNIMDPSAHANGFGVLVECFHAIVVFGGDNDKLSCSPFQ